MLKYFDLLSQKNTLHYHNYNSHPSKFSAILSILTYILCIAATIYFSLDIIRHLNPTTYFFFQQEKDVGFFPVNESSMFHFINLENIPEGEDPMSLIQIFGSMEVYVPNYKENIGSRLGMDHYTYGPCPEKSDTYKLNDIYNAFSNSDLKKMGFCINGFYNSTTGKHIFYNDSNFEYPIMKHGTSHPNYTSYTIFIQRCENDTFYLFNKCKSIDYIDKLVTANQVDAMIGFLNQEADISNYSFPIKHTFINIRFTFSHGMFSVSNLNFQPLRVRTHNGFLFDNVVLDYSYYYEQNDIKNYQTEFKIYTCFHFWMQNKVQIYERNYKRIQNIMADSGGMIKALTTISTIINIILNKYQIVKDVNKMLNKKFEKIASTNKLINALNTNNNNASNLSIKHDNFLDKGNNKSQNSITITNRSIILNKNNNMKKYELDVKNLDYEAYHYIKDNRNLRENINLVSIIKNMIDVKKKEMSKEQTYINIIMYFYKEVINEQNLFDLFFFYRKLNKLRSPDMIFKSIISQKKNEQMI